MDEDILRTEEQTKTKIIDAVIDTLEQEGEDGITVRGIANKAGVNPALINYHFGAKERLVAAAFRFLMGKNYKVFDFLKDKSIPARDRLVNFFEAFYTTISQYPGFVKTQVSRLISGRLAEMDIGFIVRGPLASLFETVIELTNKDEELAVMRIVQTMPALILPSMIHATIAKFGGFDLDDPATRQRYIALLADNIAAKEK
jgi:AcrR family transcriptional regulator